MVEEPSSELPDDKPAEDVSNAASSSNVATSVTPLRLWPAIVLVIGLWSLRIVPGLFEELSVPVMMARFMGPLVCAGLIVLWWLFLSRASLKEKALGVIALAVILAVTTVVADKTVKGIGTMIYAVPWGMTTFAVALIVTRWVPTSNRVWYALLAAAVGFGFWDLVRTDEIRGDFQTARSWRWQPTAEDRFLQELAARDVDRPPMAAAGDGLAAPEWPAFRGPHRDGAQPGIVLAEDWETDPPEEIWRVPVGPGWSSFSVAGARLFTQEQRGEDEVVVCYDAATGREVWAHEYPSRFWEVVGGAGPRATPTLSEGGLYALGANGVLLRLDPLTGEPVWQRDIRQDAERDPPQWGFASSPLVTDGVVIVHAGGAEGKGVLAYDLETGDQRWSVAAGDHSYSSPHLAEVCGKSSVLVLTNKELSIIEPTSGRLMGKHEWEYQGYRVVQPLLLGDSTVLMGSVWEPGQGGLN